MPVRTIRYHAQRKHIIYSLDALLYELHTLSFLLSPSIFVLLCRCITQFQFARVRELDGRRSLAFWLGLVALVNVSAVWGHAFADIGTGGGGRGKGVVLDFVGMGHKPARSQLLLLDCTIIFLQALLSTISYETSLILAMPEEFEDPLLPLSSSSSLSGTTAHFDEEAAPLFSSQSRYPSVALDLDLERAPIGTTRSSVITYPPTPPTRTATPRPLSSSSSSTLPPSASASASANPFSSTKPLVTVHDPLPPTIPIIDLRLRHIIRRLSSPVPEPPIEDHERSEEAEGASSGQSPYPAAVSDALRRFARLRSGQSLRDLRVLEERGEARTREQQRRQQQRMEEGNVGSRSGPRPGRGDAEGEYMRTEGQSPGAAPGRSTETRNANDLGSSRSRRIPGAIEFEDEEEG